MKNIGIQFFFLHSQYNLKLKIYAFSEISDNGGGVGLGVGRGGGVRFIQYELKGILVCKTSLNFFYKGSNTFSTTFMTLVFKDTWQKLCRAHNITISCAP